MKNNLLFSAIVAILSFGLLAVNAIYAEPAPMNSGDHMVSQLLWTDVRSPQGEYLGKIADFVIDSGGHVTLAIINRGSLEADDNALVAVPFGSLSLKLFANFWVLDTTREKLAAAPPFKTEDLSSSTFTEDTYRYFGVEPSWTDQPRDRGIPTYKDPYDLMVHLR